MTLLIRTARLADAEALLNIYAPYVENTAVSFEYEIPAAEEFARRIKTTLERYPYLVAVGDGEIVGYAYASAFKQRAAYAWAVETSIYLKASSCGRGIGKQLYLALEDILKQQHVLNLNACVSYRDQEDPHLNHGSKLFHERLGYRQAARFHQCGYKFGAWYDMIWLEKMIGAHEDNPAPFVPFSQLF